MSGLKGKTKSRENSLSQGRYIISGNTLTPKGGMLGYF